MNTLLYNNRNGCFNFCNTCNGEDKLYKYEIKIVGEYTSFGSTEFTKKNEVTKLFYSFAPGDPSYLKTDGEYWYFYDNNTWNMFAKADTDFSYNGPNNFFRTIIKCND